MVELKALIVQGRALGLMRRCSAGHVLGDPPGQTKPVRLCEYPSGCKLVLNELNAFYHEFVAMDF
jgi:hypothetical protein